MPVIVPGARIPMGDAASRGAPVPGDDAAAPSSPDRRLDPALGGIALATAAFVALFAAVKRDRTRALDLAMTIRIQGRRSAPLRLAMRAASWPGFPPQSRILPPLVILAWLVIGRPRAALFQLLAWGGALVSTIVKSLVRRPRPLPPQVEVV